MRILELCLSPDYGGLELHMRDFSSWLNAREDVELYLCVQENSRIHQDLQKLNLPSLLFSGKAGKLSFEKAMKLKKFIEKNEIEVVHVHWKFDLPLVALTKRLSRRKFRFVHTRQMNMPGRKKDLYHRFIYRAMDRFVAITKYIERQARENLPIVPERITQVYYGVKVPEGLSSHKTAALKNELGIQGDYTIGLLGRLSEYKGQHLLIEAVDRLSSEGIRIDAWIVGAAFEPDYEDLLKEMVQRRELTDRIHFMNFYPDPISLMSCFDTVALTTKNETFGLVLIEAMHAGVAVIGSDAGGVPEIIDHKETGLLFESWNSGALAKAIQVFFDDENLRRQMATAGQKKARNKFDLETQYQKFLDTLR